MDAEYAERVPVSSVEELLEYAKKEGIELADEDLEKIAGGSSLDYCIKCPKCALLSYAEFGEELNECVHCHTEFHFGASGGW